MPKESTYQTTNNLEELSLKQIPRTLRWFTVWSCVAMPYLFYLGIGSLFSYSYGFRHSLLFSFLGALTAVTIYAWMLMRGWSDLAAMGMGLIASVIVLGIWFDLDGFSPMIALDIPLVLFAFFRVRQLCFAQSASEQNRRMFKTDSIVLIIVIPFYALGQSGVNTAGLKMAGEVVVGISVLYVFARIYTLWMYERVETGTKGSSRAGLYTLIAAAVVLTVITPFILIHAFFAIFALAAVPALLIAGLLQKLGIFHRMKPRPKGVDLQPQNTHTLKHPLPHAAAHVSQHQISTLTIVVGIVIVLILLVVFIRSRRGKLGAMDANETEVVKATVRRSWMFRDFGLRFLATQDPVRLRYQTWLRKHAEDGRELKTAETPRQFGHRVRPLDTEADVLTRAYEERRYRDGK